MLGEQLHRALLLTLAGHDDGDPSAVREPTADVRHGGIGVAAIAGDGRQTRLLGAERGHGQPRVAQPVRFVPRVVQPVERGRCQVDR